MTIASKANLAHRFHVHVEHPRRATAPGMDSRQKLIEIAKVIFTELASRVALRFKRRGDCASLCWYADLGAGLANSGHALLVLGAACRCAANRQG